ncbi:hypothetical protein R3P38DRAFT_2830054 [Favolaschia claudopus]|uniref:Uncharacterized protein n=1 Tax=Favolaschia claudopus TaxID=2862362 RepID=A0AAW0E7R5_9AGAR
MLSRPVCSPLPATMRTKARTRQRRGIWKGTCKRSSLASSSRTSPGFASDNTSDDEECYYIIEYDPLPQAGPSSCEMDANEETDTKVEDWEDLKELFGRAAEQYENDNVAEALPLLRGVIHECHRLLLLYEDPSVLFVRNPNRSRSQSPDPISISPSSSLPRIPKKCKCKESPTAFHAILGTALFLLGNYIAQDASLALPDEPNTGITYWLAALDVFETGENLPSRTNPRGCEAQEDWRMAIIWGRTLLAVADEILSLASDRERSTNPLPIPPERKWHSAAASPFAAIAMRRPPASRRITLTTASPHDLLLLAMDQFARGIFHMPHPAHAADDAPMDTARPFSRATELFTIAREVLALAERLPDPAERMRWATWADTVLQQMDMEGDTTRTEWRGLVSRARGRCWLIVGTAEMEDIEAKAEEGGWDEVLNSEEADEAREGLARAVEYFERATQSAKGELGVDEGDDDELRAFLAEALVTLANLTKDEDKREELYRRAQLLGGDELEGMDLDD